MAIRVVELEVWVWLLVLLGIWVGIFCPTPDVQMDLLLYHTPKLGIPVEMGQFLLKFLLEQISCCAPWFPLISTAKLHSLYVKKSRVGSQKFWKGWSRRRELEILEKSDISPATPQPWWHAVFMRPKCIIRTLKIAIFKERNMSSFFERKTTMFSRKLFVYGELNCFNTFSTRCFP